MEVQVSGPTFEARG